MTTVKFDKAVKYQGVRYAAHEAFKVEDADVAQLKKAGATVLATEDTTPPAPAQGQEEPGVEEGQEVKYEADVEELREKLLGFTVAELTEFAQENDIDLQGKTRKADIYNLIVAALN